MGKSTDGAASYKSAHPTRPDERENQLAEPKLRSIPRIGIISPDQTKGNNQLTEPKLRSIPRIGIISPDQTKGNNQLAEQHPTGYVTVFEE